MSMVLTRKVPLKETVKASPASAPKEVIHLSFEDLGLIGNGAMEMSFKLNYATLKR